MASLLAALMLTSHAWAGNFEPGATYYVERFDPALKPWNPGQALNIEEVFKNYQYYEILFDSTGTRLTVNRYTQGSKTEIGHYQVAPDGGLKKDDRVGASKIECENTGDKLALGDPDWLR